MKDSISKIYLGVVIVGFTTLFFQLLPISKQASTWNRCLRKTSKTMSQVQAVKEMNEESREILSVMICNGAVFEPEFKSNMQ